MELQSRAQDINFGEIVVEDGESMPIVLTPISHPQEQPFIEVVDTSAPQQSDLVDDLQGGTVEFVIQLPDDLEGSRISPEGEASLEVVEEDPKDKESKKDKDDKDDNDARKSKKADHWDWESKGHEGFLEWIKDRFGSVPKHSGYDTSGLERAVSYLEKLDNEISKAMRLDLDGNLDADKIEDVRSKIEDGIDRLHDRLEKVKKKGKKKKADFVADDALVKEAQKAAGVRGIYVMAPLFISCIARTLINGYISAGHDMEDMFKKLSTKYKLNEREKMETVQLLSDMGFPVRQDRGLLDEEVDVTSSDNFDWAANYKA